MPHFWKAKNELHKNSEGDKVNVELSPYDLTRGRITWRKK